MGDITVLALVTIAGFATHDELDTAGLRMLTTFLPLGVAWMVVSIPLGLYDPNFIHDPRYLWRPFWAMLLAAPLAGLLRSLWLGAVIIPVFVLVLGGISSVAIGCWRGLYWLLVHRQGVSHG